jgi:hypothetical protein
MENLCIIVITFIFRSSQYIRLIKISELNKHHVSYMLQKQNMFNMI